MVEVATGRRAAASRSTLVCNALHRYYRYYPYYTYYEYYTDVRATSREQRPSLNGFPLLLSPCPSPPRLAPSPGQATISHPCVPIAFSRPRVLLPSIRTSPPPVPFAYSPRSYLFTLRAPLAGGLTSATFSFRSFSASLSLFISPQLRRGLLRLRRPPLPSSCPGL